jgi:hypothetical protein
MSKRINVNPDHYKTAGRERPGDDVPHQIEKRKVRQLRAEERQMKGRAGSARKR